MCLAIPMKVVEIENGSMARVEAMGAAREIAIDLTPEVSVGNYVLVHAGFSIEIVDEQYAAETLELIQTMADLVDDPMFNEGAVA